MFHVPMLGFTRRNQIHCWTCLYLLTESNSINVRLFLFRYIAKLLQNVVTVVVVFVFAAAAVFFGGDDIAVSFS